MEPVTAKNFWEKWKDVVQCEDKQAELLSLWKNKRAYTEAILRSDKAVLRLVAEGMGLDVYPRDYYYLDAILFKENEDKIVQIQYELLYGPPAPTDWVHTIRVAFEHENNFSSGLFMEAAHLLLINCELRVLVTYPDSYSRHIRDSLSYLHKVISSNPSHAQISEEGSFLIILGYLKNCYRWEGYVYRADGWELLEGSMSSYGEPLEDVIASRQAL